MNVDDFDRRLAVRRRALAKGLVWTPVVHVAVTTLAFRDWLRARGGKRG